ncbi:MAG TPA: RNA methyltransferase [Pyrinomonadaceae bacterium]|jgi:TrmH family RNA methyltransferase|nr:RNA methyltransferase [Pyrinomonadaceae bacterium]
MITSRDNSLLRLARSVRDGKTPEFIFVEGMRLCEEALRSGLSIESVIVSDELAAKEKAVSLIEKLAAAAKRTAFVSENLLESISYTRTPQGIVLLAERPETTEQHFAAQQKDPALVVIMHRINNPVNVGAILRTAEAAGATGAVATQHTADPFSAKALRGAMGSAFRLPVWFAPTFTEAVGWCSRHSIQTICADVHASTGYDEVAWMQPSALILGAESSGLTREEIEAANGSVRIPMRGPAESLNVAVATGVLLYEAARQRQSQR